MKPLSMVPAMFYFLTKVMVTNSLQIAVKRREAKGKGEKKRYSHLNAECQRIARRDKKAFTVSNTKK